MATGEVSKYNQVGDFRKVIMERLSQNEIEFATRCLKATRKLHISSFRLVVMRLTCAKPKFTTLSHWAPRILASSSSMTSTEVFNSK